MENNNNDNNLDIITFDDDYSLTENGSEGVSPFVIAAAAAGVGAGIAIGVKFLIKKIKEKKEKKAKEAQTVVKTVVDGEYVEVEQETEA